MRHCKGNRESDQVETGAYATAEWACESEHEHIVEC